MSSPRFSLFRSALIALVAPAIACGGDVQDDTAQTSPGSSGGASGGTTGGAGSPSKGGSSQAGAAGSTSGVAGQGGSSSAGSSAGGTSAGGTSAGGANVGGESSGGTSAGGTSAGGTSAGGTSAGGEGGASAGGAGGANVAGQGGASVGGQGGASVGGQGGANVAGQGGAAGQGGVPFPCINPTPIVVDGVDTGYDTCDNGMTRRRDVVTCPSLLPRADVCNAGGAGGTTGGCTTDADCNAQPNGHCDLGSGFDSPPGCFCAYGCTTDAECGPGAICVCGDPVGHCVSAQCTSDDACAVGSCSTYEPNPGCPGTAFACQSLQDQCGGNADCPPDMPFCAVDPVTQARQCVSWQCAIGRPLFIHDMPVVALLAARSEWAALSPMPSLLPEPPPLPDEQRATASYSLRYEDIAPDGRMTLLAMPQSLGHAIWRTMLIDHPASEAIAAQGVVPVLSRLIVEGTAATSAPDDPVQASGGYVIARSNDAAGAVDRLFMNMWVEICAPFGHALSREPRGPLRTSGRVFAEHVFTRLFAPPTERRVRSLDLPGFPSVPSLVYDASPPETAASLPPGAEPLDDTFSPDDAPIHFGLDHSDSNQHVNSLVYLRLFVEASLRRLARHGHRSPMLARQIEIAYRKPCFAGDAALLKARAFRVAGSLGALVTLSPSDRPDERPHCFGRVIFG